MEYSLKTQGLALLELLIIVVIIAILAAIIFPSYLNYSKKAYYNAIIQATLPYKVAVTQCYHNLGTLTGCSGGINGIPADIAIAQGGPIASLTTTDGIIT